jgi:hypothetical protein
VLAKSSFFYDSFNKTEFRSPTLHRRCDLCGIADGETYLDLRIGLLEGNQVPRKPIAGDRLARLNGQRAPFQAAEFAEREFGGFGPRQYCAGFREEDAAGFRQLDAAPDPIEQLRVMPRLQSRDRRLAADCARFKARAACVTCCRSATATKMRSCSRVVLISPERSDLLISR